MQAAQPAWFACAGPPAVLDGPAGPVGRLFPETTGWWTGSGPPGCGPRPDHRRRSGPRRKRRVGPDVRPESAAAKRVDEIGVDLLSITAQPFEIRPCGLEGSVERKCAIQPRPRAA